MKWQNLLSWGWSKQLKNVWSAETSELRCEFMEAENHGCFCRYPFQLWRDSLLVFGIFQVRGLPFLIILLLQYLSLLRADFCILATHSVCVVWLLYLPWDEAVNLTERWLLSGMLMTRIIESLNHPSWKRPTRSSSPTIHLSPIVFPLKKWEPTSSTGISAEGEQKDWEQSPSLGNVCPYFMQDKFYLGSFSCSFNMQNNTKHRPDLHWCKMPKIYFYKPRQSHFKFEM